MASGFTRQSERRAYSMEKEDIEIQNVQTLSEKCRIALEKSYGFKIPLPKSIGKQRKKGTWFLGEM
jgi:hypothetical protein